MATQLPTFVATTPGPDGADQPLSFVRLAFVVGGRLLTFQAAVTDPASVQAVADALAREAENGAGR